MEFYEHSGRCGPVGVPIAAAAGAVAGLVLGFAYSYFINWVPIIYLSFFATAGFGFAVGAAVAWGAKVGKIRSMAIAAGISVTMAALAVYFAWVFDPMARIAGINVPVWDPDTLFEYMKLGYQEGFWSIGRGGGGEVKGMFLAAVWLIEAGIIVGVAVFTTLAMLGTQPYCEETDQWTTTEKGVASLSLIDPEAEAKLQRLFSGDLNVLGEFYLAAADDAAVLRLDLATARECALCNFLTAKVIQTTIDKKGETSTEESDLLTNLRVAEEDVATIRNAGLERPPAPVAADDVENQAGDVAASDA